MFPRTLALDYGEKRIGAAVSDPLGLTAQPLPYIVNDDHIWLSLDRVVDEYQVVQIMLGLPKGMSGQDTQQTRVVRDFFDLVCERYSFEVFFRDERLSTQAAQKHLLKADVSRRKRKESVDSLSAAFFLQGYLDAGAGNFQGTSLE